MSTVLGLLGTAAQPAVAVTTRLDHLEAAARRMAEAIVAVEKSVADLDKRVAANAEAIAALDKRTAGLDPALGKKVVEMDQRIGLNMARIEELIGRANTNAEAIARGVARDQWVARAILTCIHPPHGGPPEPPTPAPEAAAAAVPLPVDQGTAQQAAERSHALLGLAIDTLGGRLTDEEFAAGPPPV